jgi:hypothetical protein
MLALVNGCDRAAASGELHTPASLHFTSNKKMLRCTENACCKCTFQLFHTDVTKVDRNVAYVAMIVHVCCKLPSPMFHRVFWTYCYTCVYLNIANLSHICCKRFIWILCIFSMGFKCFHVFLQMFQKYVSFVFRCCCKCCI